MMDNRTIIAIVLIVLLWSGYSLFFTPYQPQQINETDVSTSAPPVESTVSSAPQLPVNDGTTPSSRGVEKIITISSDLYDIELSTKGATVKSVSFNKYKETMDDSSEQLFLLDNSNFSHFSLKTTGSDGLALPSDLIYSLKDSENDNYIVTGEKLVLSFYSDFNNLSVIKEFTFHTDTYHVDLKTYLINNNDVNTSGKFNISLVTPWSEDEKGDFYSFTGPLTYDGNKLQEDKPKDIIKKPVIYRDFKWSGFTNKYFLQALHSKDVMEQVFITSESESIINQFTTPSFYLSPGERTSFEFTSYFGPKEYDFLSSSETSFEEAIHFGFFHFLAKPLFDVLKFFYSYLNNYGFSIILLTVCIKLIFWPLTQKSYKSMQGMQKLQPEMKRLKEKYADNKQRLNQEMMAFYKENKVNPLGGCLPIVIQIPVFFSLYKVLLDSIELRHAPFMFWITDLSAKDPFYITPLIMGASMFLQQKLTPTNMDPTQEKIMLMMPVIFTFMFLNFPSGLVLYWLVNNLLTIFQQLLIRRKAAIA